MTETFREGNLLNYSLDPSCFTVADAGLPILEEAKKMLGVKSFSFRKMVTKLRSLMELGVSD